MVTIVDEEETNILGKLIAETLINKLRSADAVDETIVKSVNRMPWIDYIRALINESDFKWIEKMTCDIRVAEKTLAISLLQNIGSTKRVEILLNQLWEQNIEFIVRWHIAPRLLDIKNLKYEMHRQIYHWIKANWSAWSSELIKWCGGCDQVLSMAKERLNDQKFPDTKAWHYLLFAFASNDKQGIKVLLSKYTESNNTLVKEVALELLGELTQ